MIRQLRSLGYRIEAPNPQPSQARAQLFFEPAAPSWLRKLPKKKQTF
jgi:hypothetical protein